MFCRPSPTSISRKASLTGSPSSVLRSFSTASARPMDSGCRSIGARRMSNSDASIEIRDLCKIFGRSPEQYVEAVRNGLSKAELGKTHGHILGLNNINISIPAGKIQVVMGLSGSGKSTLIRHINRLIEPTSGSIVIDGRNILEMSEAELREFRRN